MLEKTHRVRTGDRGPPEGSEIHTIEQLGPKMSKMQNGNLVCYDVPIARTGWMVYLAGEVPLEADPETGYIRVYRGPDDLFHPNTVGSFMGAAVTDEHPEDDVDPDNWKKLAFGFATTNVRRGEGDDADVLFADLIITDASLIESILGGKREVSCGYEADYTQVSPGVGNQTNIIGNHIALVEKGRCGPRCAIGDRQPTKEPPMTNRVKLITKDRRAALRKLFRDAEGLLEETADPGMDDTDSDIGGTHIHIHTNGTSGQGQSVAEDLGDTPPNEDGPGFQSKDEGGGDPIEQRLATLEQGLQQLSGSVAQLAEAVQAMTGGTPSGDEMPDDLGEEDGEKPAPTADEGVDMPGGKPAVTASTGDSAALGTSFKQLLSDIEILVPGFRAPTFDAKAKRASTIDKMCNLRRRVLDSCYSTVAGKQIIDSVAGQEIDTSKMSCQQVAQVFRASVGAKKLLTNRSTTGDASQVPVVSGTAPKAVTISDLNKANAEFWNKQGVKA